MASNPAVENEIKIGSILDGDSPVPDPPYLAIDLDQFVASRGYIEANSGGGKSYAIRVVMEQTKDRIQQFLFDVDDEFATLRELGDYLLVNGSGADMQVGPDAAGLLAIRLLETGASAIINLYDLSVGDPDDPETNERTRFVAKFIHAMMSAPQRLWHPVLVVVDEAHLFAPEGRRATSKRAIIELMSLGRKRPYCGVLATQRPTKISKDAIAECNNVLIGRAARPGDIREAAKELGFNTTEAKQLKFLEPGQFFATGPAFNVSGVAKVKISRAQTTHRTPGKIAGRPPATGHVLKLVKEFADLPTASATEITDIDAARAKIADLERQLAAKPATAAGKTVTLEKVVEKIVEIKTPAISQDDLNRVDQAKRACDAVRVELEKMDAALHKVWDENRGTMADIERIQIDAISSKRVFDAQPRSERPKANVAQVSTAPELVRIPGETTRDRILNALAWVSKLGTKTVSKNLIAAIADVSPTSSATERAFASLKAEQFIAYLPGGKVSITDYGARAATVPEGRPNVIAAFRALLAEGTPQRIFDQLVAAYPDAIKRSSLTGVTLTSSATERAIAAMRGLGILEFPEKGKLRATDMLVEVRP